MTSETRNRRQFLRAGLPAALSCGVILAGCSDSNADTALQWRMKCSWAKDMPGLYASAQRLVDRINAQTQGRLKINLVSADQDGFRVFDQVAAGEFEMGYSTPLFWAGKSAACALFAGAPFGLTGTELNQWLLAGEGLPLWRELYAHFGLLPMPAGNLGAQMAGWFTREVRGLRSIRGLKIRATGLTAEVWNRLGAQARSVNGDALVAALKDRTVEAAEWMGPWHDQELGLHMAASNYYFPGWQEPGTNLECLINKAAFDALAPDLQASVETACLAVHLEESALNAVRNQQALLNLVGVHKVNVRKLPADVLVALSQASNSVLSALAEQDSFAKKVYESLTAFREQARQWQRVGEGAFVGARG
jgi:TRAP-type mannitol/chloroaromatic compound transport system substrate-binding protein